MDDVVVVANGGLLWPHGFLAEKGGLQNSEEYSPPHISDLFRVAGA